jgi:hypothetical protein
VYAALGEEGCALGGSLLLEKREPALIMLIACGITSLKLECVSFAMAAQQRMNIAHCKLSLRKGELVDIALRGH